MLYRKKKTIMAVTDIWYSSESKGIINRSYWYCFGKLVGQEVIFVLKYVDYMH